MNHDGASPFRAARLRELRDQAGLTIHELYKRSGISAAELTNYEAGRVPRPARIVMLAKTFGVDPFELLDRDVIGYGLQSLRVAAGLLQTDVMIRADVSISLLTKLEAGYAKRLPDDVADRLASALNTTPEAIKEAHAWDVANFDSMGAALPPGTGPPRTGPPRAGPPKPGRVPVPVPPDWS
jgi:transcriptional regulator with XRE-family HTH domain